MWKEIYLHNLYLPLQNVKLLYLSLYVYRYSKENKLPSLSEKQLHHQTIKQAEDEIIRTGKYHIGKNMVAS